MEPFFFPNTVAVDVREKSRWALLFTFSRELFLRWLRFTDLPEATARDGLTPAGVPTFMLLGSEAP